MPRAVLVSSTPFVLLIAFLFAAACCGIGMLLTRDRMEGPLGSWPFRWFSLIDIIAAACFIVIVVALSFLIFHVPDEPPMP